MADFWVWAGGALIIVGSFIDDHQRVLQFIMGFATLLLAIVGFLYSVPRIQRELKKLRNEQDRAASSSRRLDEIGQLSEQGQGGIWSRNVDWSKLDYHNKLQQSIPIILLANLKGGVGKTTIAANLAAALSDNENVEIQSTFERKAGEKKRLRVLAIDLDYQGSMSSLFIGANDKQHNKSEAVDIATRGISLLSGEQDGAWAAVAAQPLEGRLSNLRYFATNSEMADLENRLFLRWLIGNATTDVRFNLYRILSSTDIQSSFDYIIIDTAPRLTLAFINGMCTATHLLIPSGMDSLAAQSAGNFINQYQFLKPRICPQLEITGILPSMTYYREPGQFTGREMRIVHDLQALARRRFHSKDLFLDSCNVRRDIKITEAAGEKLAYFLSGESRTIFTALAKEVIERTRR